MPKRINHTKNHHIVWLAFFFLIKSVYQEEFYGFTDLDVAAASEKADSLRKEGDLLKHDLAEARAHKVGTKTFSRRKNIFPFFFYWKNIFALRQFHCPVLYLSVLKL